MNKTMRDYINLIESVSNIRESTVGTMLYHGTSLKEFERLLKSGFKVNDFYLGDDLDNIAMNYAEIQSRRDGTEGVVVYFDLNFIDKSKLEKDIHGIQVDDSGEAIEDVEQIGQYIFNGDLSDAVITAFNVDTGKRIYMSPNYKWRTMKINDLYEASIEGYLFRTLKLDKDYAWK